MTGTVAQSRRRSCRWRQLLEQQPPAPPAVPGWSRACCRRRASCLWAASRRWANPCWWPTSRSRWRPARIAPGFPIPAPRRVLVCQFELPMPAVRQPLWPPCVESLGAAADQHLLVDTRAAGHLLSAPQGLQHFLTAAHAAAAEIIVLDPLYSTHDQDENDTRAMAALCQSLLRLREASRAALIVVHHVRKSIGRYEIGSAFRGSSALHAVGDSLPAADATLASIQHRRTALPVSLRGPAAATLAPTRCLTPCGSPLPVCRRRRWPPTAARWNLPTCAQALTDLASASSLQPTSPANHDADRLLQTHSADWPSRQPANKARSCRPMAITPSPGRASGCWQQDPPGSRPSGCPRPMRRSWLRRNRLTPPVRHARPEGSYLLP